MDNETKRAFASLETLIETSIANLNDKIDDLKDFIKDVQKSQKEDHDRITELRTYLSEQKSNLKLLKEEEKIYGINTSKKIKDIETDLKETTDDLKKITKTVGKISFSYYKIVGIAIGVGGIFAITFKFFVWLVQLFLK